MATEASLPMTHVPHPSRGMWSWLTRLSAPISAERDRWPLWIPVILATGIGTYFSLPFEPAMWTGSIAIAAVGALLLAVIRFPLPRMICLVFLIVAGGFAVAQWRTHQVAAPVLMKRYGPAQVEGHVISIDRLPRGPRVVLDEVILDRLPSERTPARVRIRLRRGETVQVGDRISVVARLSPPPLPAMPGAYDFQRHAWFSRLGGVGFALGRIAPASGRTGPADIGSTALWLSALRNRMAERIRAAVPDERGAVAAALIVGDRSAIPRAVMDAMRDSGLAHLLAISGLHIGLVAALLFFSIRLMLAAIEPLALRAPIKKWAAVFALTGAFGYLFLAGATIPTQRAFVMTGLVLVGIVLDRNAISLRLVAWAAMAVLLVFPESLVSASFQLSFAAVIALVAAYEGLRRPLRDWLVRGGRGRRVSLYFACLAISTLVAGTATGVVALHHFGRFSQYGLAANVVAIPVTAFWIMPFGVLACMLMPFGLEAFALVPMAYGIELLLWVARSVAGWPGAVAHVSAMPTTGLVMIAAGGLWLCLWRGHIRWLGIGGLVLGLVSIPLSPRPDVIVSETGKLMAVRLADGRLALSSLRKQSFAAKIWLERDGETEIRGWTTPASAPPLLNCDSLGCIYDRHHWRIALVRDARALAEDCNIASLVVSAVPVRSSCRDAALVIDRFDLWRNGGYAIWVSEDEIEIASVRAARGDRLWSAQPKRRAARLRHESGRLQRVNISASSRSGGPEP